MSHWNYRIVKTVTTVRDYTEETFQFHEVYYDNDSNVENWTQPVAPLGESIEELKHNIEQMMKAFEKPIMMVEDNKLIEIKKEI